MYMKLKDNYYNEDLMQGYCRQWQAATKEIEYQRIYSKMSVVLNTMFKRIKNRYFQILQHDVSSVQAIAITKCFLSIQDYNFQHKSFSWFQTIIKNELFDFIYVHVMRKNSIYFEDLTLVDVEQDKNYELIDKSETYSDYKEELIGAIELKKIKYPQDINILSDIIYFLQNHEMKFLADIYIYLFKIGYSIKYIKHIFRKIFNAPARINQTLETENKTDKTAENCSNDEYYRDPVYSTIHQKNYQRKKYKNRKTHDE